MHEYSESLPRGPRSRGRAPRPGQFPLRTKGDEAGARLSALLALPTAGTASRAGELGGGDSGTRGDKAARARGVSGAGRQRAQPAVSLEPRVSAYRWLGCAPVAACCPQALGRALPAQPGGARGWPQMWEEGRRRTLCRQTRGSSLSLVRLRTRGLSKAVCVSCSAS